jgi:hypothetical protein
MSQRLYTHVILGVPGAVRAEIANYLDDDTKRGEALRNMMRALHRERVCIAPYRGTSYHVYLITVDDDMDAGNIRLLLNRWPTIVRLAAFRQTGEQLGQTRNDDGTVTGTPRYQLDPAEYAALKAVWPAAHINADGKLTPPNRMQGQTDWSF